MPEPSQLRGATVVGTGSYIPERVLTNADLERLVDTSGEWLLTRTGIRERHAVSPGQASCDMAFAAARRALEMAGRTALDLDRIIVASLIRAGQADTVLAIGVETLSSATDSEDRTTCVLFGDGAGESGPGVPVACGGGSAA
jgi:3-oxoacyl-[acyl-carrier-protein] synthase-3